MTLEQLRIFIAVAERQHVTQAAQALHLAQSAVSANIAALEASYQTQLFHRVGRRIELTEAGRLFLAEARSVLARAAGAELVLAELGGLLRGTLNVAASQTIASYWLPRHLVAMRARYPALAIDLQVGNTAQVAAAVRAGEAELGFVEGTVDDPLLESAVVATDALVIVTGPHHDWTRSPPAAPADLLTTPWILREPGSGTRSEFEAALQAFGLDPAALTVMLELPTNESVRAAVESGPAATAISASVAAGALEVGLLHLVPFKLPDRPFKRLQHRERYRSKGAQALIQLLEEP